MVHDCTDSLALLSQVNTDLEQNRCNLFDCILSRQSIPHIEKKCTYWFWISFWWWFTKKNNECYCKQKALLHLKLLFNHTTPISKVQKTCVDSLKTLGITTKMGTKTELVNTRNNTAATTATNIPHKRNIKIGRSS